jgi:CBS domain-containing protein
MAQSISEIMTHDPRTVDTGATVQDAAREMRDGDIGAVLVVDNGSLTGIVTDRDIVVRGVADGRDPGTPVTEVCTRDPQTLTPDQSVEDAIRIVREDKVRRIPVVQDARPVGIVSIGDLAIERDEDSALAEISASPENN